MAAIQNKDRVQYNIPRGTKSDKLVPNKSFVPFGFSLFGTFWSLLFNVLDSFG